MKSRSLDTAQAIKSVVQQYSPTQELLELLNDFRLMINDCIRIGMKEGISSMRKLSLACYRQLDQYPVTTAYRLTAISKASGILRNFRKTLKKNPNTKKPHARTLMLTDCYRFRIQGKRLRLTIRSHEYIYINLNRHTLEAIKDHEVRSVTLTESNLSLSYSKVIQEIEPRGSIGIDRNLDNLTIATSKGDVKPFDLSKATQVNATYHEVKTHFKRNDVRVRRNVFGKYGTLQRNKVNQILHRTSKEIVTIAKQDNLAIVMEDLKGIRKLYRKGNGQGNKYRRRMNSWSYGELQRQIDYKARWEGMPVIHVAARGTSATCSMCGSRTYPNERRTLYCPECRTTVDRDENAARNILERGGLRFSPNGPSGEAMVAEPRKPEVIRTVDGGKTALGVAQR